MLEQIAHLHGGVKRKDTGSRFMRLRVEVSPSFSNSFGPISHRREWWRCGRRVAIDLRQYSSEFLAWRHCCFHYTLLIATCVPAAVTAGVPFDSHSVAMWSVLFF